MPTPDDDLTSPLPDGDDEGNAPQVAMSAPITPARLAVGILAVEQLLEEMEQLISAHLDAVQLTTNDAALSVIQAFLAAHKALTEDTLRYAEQLGVDGAAFVGVLADRHAQLTTQATQDPSASSAVSARSARSTLGDAGQSLLERCSAGKQTLEFLNGATARGLQLAARMRDAHQPHATHATHVKEEANRG